MLAVREIKHLTVEHEQCLVGYAWHDFRSPDHEDVLKSTVKMWEVRDGKRLAIVAGIVKTSTFAVPEIWWLLCNGFESHKVSNLRECRRLMGELMSEYPMLRARVEVTFVKGLAFAKFVGFRWPKLVGPHNEKLYWLFEARA